MADRSSFGLAYKAQGAFGTLATAPYKLLPLATWDPGFNAQRLNDDTIRASRLGAPGRAGTIAVQPTMATNFRPVAYDDLLAGVFGQAAWATDVLTQGETLRYFSFEDRQPDATSFLPIRDAVPNSLRLSVGQGFIRSEWGFLATVLTTEATGTASPTAADEEEPFDSFTGSFAYAGGDADVTALTINFANNHEGRSGIFKGRYPTKIIKGVDAVTGTMTLAYTGPERLDDLINDTANALTFEFLFGDSSMEFALPAVLTSGWSAPVDTGAERLQTVNWEARAVNGTKVTVTRDYSV